MFVWSQTALELHLDETVSTAMKIDQYKVTVASNDIGL